MKKPLALIVFLLSLCVLVLSSQEAGAQPGMPPNNPKRGLIYDGLELPSDGSCRGAFRVKGVTARGRPLCTHGPDAGPANLDMTQASAPAPLAATTLSTVCDGDGTSGYRIQVIYAHASDVADRYATYLSSFQQWASDADAIYDASAAETGGSRHVRFVHDASCAPMVVNVTLSPTGDDDFSYTVSELQAQGYNRTDRDYLVFGDATIYCGIANMQYDDRAISNNVSNFGPQYARVDTGCWDGRTAAHESMHNLGGVQMSAPHSSGGGHCIDEYDRMCYSDSPYFPALQYPCPNGSSDDRFDCNHDDYYSTNPPAISYLATHWNAANNQFLIGGTAAPSPTPTPVSATARVDSLVTGKLKGKAFTQTDSFVSGDTVIVRAHVVNQSGVSLAGATVTLAVTRPDGVVQCTRTATTDASGTAQAACKTPTRASTGSWDSHLNGASATGYTTDLTNSTKDHIFQVLK